MLFLTSFSRIKRSVMNPQMSIGFIFIYLPFSEFYALQGLFLDFATAKEFGLLEPQQLKYCPRYFFVL